MYTNNRNAYRQTFFDAWQKYKKKLPLEAVEAQLIKIILLHPEYHSLLEQPRAYQHQEFSLEENPFFHMSIHLAIHEQINTDRPAGINEIYKTLLEKYADTHQVEHYMMQCLAQLMWQAQQDGSMPSDEEYLKALGSGLTPK